MSDDRLDTVRIEVQTKDATIFSWSTPISNRFELRAALRDAGIALDVEASKRGYE